jgi:putative transposase
MDDTDYTDFLGCLERVVRRHRLACLAYCLMPNHVHLVVQTLDGGLSNAMKALNGRYALRFNRRYTSDAHLFKNRFGAVRQDDDEQFHWTIRYVLRNPVESGRCAELGDWPWSSYRASVGDVAPPRFLALRELLAYYGDTPRVAMRRFAESVDW